jgi:hypothetical protein
LYKPLGLEADRRQLSGSQLSSAAGKREGNGSAPSAATSAALPVGARARALVREQLKHGPKPEASIMVAAETRPTPNEAL